MSTQTRRYTPKEVMREMRSSALTAWMTEHRQHRGAYMTRRLFAKILQVPSEAVCACPCHVLQPSAPS